MRERFRMPARLRLWALATLLVLGFAASSVEAGIYKYVDRDGNAHYTDSVQQVPLEYRSQVRDISPEMQEMTGFRIVEGLNGDRPAQRGAGESGGASGLDEAVDSLDSIDLGQLGAGGQMLAGMLESFGFGIILLFLLAIPLLYVVSALIFKLACRIGGEDPPGLGRACVILLAQGFAGGAAGAAVSGIAMVAGIDAEASIGTSIAVAGTSSLVSWLVNAAILASMMSYAFVKSMWIGVLHTLLTVVMIGVPIALVALIAGLAG